MKKLWNAIFNIIVYAMLLWSILSAIFVALPSEYQAMIPQFNWLTALISGGSTALVGSGGLFIKSVLTKAQNESSDKFSLLSKNYLELKEAYKEIVATVDRLNLENTDLKNAVLKNNKLLETDLQSKLSNPLIDEKVKEMIEGVLNE